MSMKVQDIGMIQSTVPASMESRLETISTFPHPIHLTTIARVCTLNQSNCSSRIFATCTFAHIFHHTWNPRLKAKEDTEHKPTSPSSQGLLQSSSILPTRTIRWLFHLPLLPSTPLLAQQVKLQELIALSKR